MEKTSWVCADYVQVWEPRYCLVQKNHRDSDSNVGGGLCWNRVAVVCTLSLQVNGGLTMKPVCRFDADAKMDEKRFHLGVASGALAQSFRHQCLTGLQDKGPQFFQFHSVVFFGKLFQGGTKVQELSAGIVC